MPTLFPFQRTGRDWLAGRRHALLADEMGLGKSAQAITAADLVNARRILVICPAIAKINWAREFEKFSSISRTVQIISSTRDTLSTAAVFIVSFELALSLYSRNRFADHLFDLLIVDEAHFLKNPEAKRTLAVMGAKGLIRQAARTWFLTGTPMPNAPHELWLLLFTLGRTKLSYSNFIFRYCEMPVGWRKGDPIRIVGAKRQAIPELKSLLSPIMLRRRKQEVMSELPPIYFANVVVEPDNDLDLATLQSFFRFTTSQEEWQKLQRELHNQHERLRVILDTPDEAGIAHPKLNLAGNISPLVESMIAANAGAIATLRRLNGCKKVKAVVEMVNEELSSKKYEKVIIFAIHRDVIWNLFRGLRHHHPVTLYGGTDEVKRARNIDHFQHDPKCRVFIGNIRAAGTAITLTAAHHVIFIEQEWTPADNAQAAMRCHRIGQKLPVYVRTVGIKESFDDKIGNALRRKMRDILAVIDAEENIFS